MNSYDLAGRIAVVTGGAQGIGYAVAERLLKSGASVASWDRQEETNRASAARLAEAGRTLAVTCDMTDWSSLVAALAETERDLAPVDILVNSAGVAGPVATVEDYDNGAWHDVIDINLNGTYYANKLVIAGMKARNYGRIVNIASIAGKEGNPTASAYSASKAAVIGLTKSLGKELATTGVTVNSVTPAAVRTPMFEQVSDAHIQYMLSKIPIGRLGTVDEIAALVCWLASEECSFSTGAVFDVSGGRAVY